MGLRAGRSTVSHPRVTDTDPQPPRRRRWLRRAALWVAGIGLLGVLVAVGGYEWFSRDLPSADALDHYEPPLPTHLRDGEGQPWRVFARERRVFRPYADIPPQLVHAFISAEDKDFFTHGGVDLLGIVRAVATNAQNYGSGKRPVGASTITQQLAKNLIVGNEVSIGRKIREAILARRIEAVFSKQEILELYLNQIFLGRNAYGIEAASQAYFGKGVDALSLPQMAYLAVLPKAPSNYSPERFADRAIARRDYVLERMAENGYVDRTEEAEARAASLGTVAQHDDVDTRSGDYFAEEVRRWLLQHYGETPARGPHSVYGGGLWVRTSFDPAMQAAAEKALRDGLVRYDRAKGWHGATEHTSIGQGWQTRLQDANLPVGYDDWLPAVVLAREGGAIRLGFEDGGEGWLSPQDAEMPDRRAGKPAFYSLALGDVVPVKKVAGDSYALKQIPEVSGGMVVEDTHTGRVLAMVGGFDARRTFNRATQALRQPGSAFKPIVYATALDNGMTPASIITDGPFCVFQSRSLGTKCFKNFSGGYAGPQTMRWGVEQSRNLMTVRAASQVGMAKVVKTATALGVGSYQPVLAIALGAGDTTVLRLTNAYAMLAQNGRRIEPTLIDYVQDRHGKTIYRADPRACDGCSADDYLGEAMPRPVLKPVQAIDARAAYQMVHIMEGVIERGTATVLRDLDRPLFGKTGTTNGPTNVWFVGGTPDLVVGVYLGYDKPRSLGGAAQGGRIAAPVFKDFAKVMLADAPKLPFVAPEGIRMIRIDRRSGKRVYGAWPGAMGVGGDPKAATIWEAFKPESEPRQVTRASTVIGGPRRVRSDADFIENAGGIY